MKILPNGATVFESNEECDAYFEQRRADHQDHHDDCEECDGTYCPECAEEPGDPND